MAEPKRSLAILCSPQGMIAQVLRNDLGWSDIVAGRLFPSAVDDLSCIKALNFLDEIRERATACDWELNARLPEGMVTLHLSGGNLGEQIFIVGATNGEDVRRLYQDMLNMNSEQINCLRAALQTNHQIARGKPATGLYDEFSRLNNELVSMQRELARKNAELERLNQLKNQFLGMAAHDLRNPLAVIQSYSELLLDQAVALLVMSRLYNAVTYSELLLDQAAALTLEERIEFLQEIHSLIRFMSNLVDDLLSVSEIEGGQLRLDLQSTDLLKLVQKNLARTRQIAARKSIDIELKAEATPPLVLDAAKIEQVLDNLVGNAVKFSKPGTTVKVWLSHQDGSITLAVQDQGPGISAAEMEKLWKPFSRAGAQGTGGERSTGLGLVIVKRIIEGHHGKIWVESKVGQGSTFFVSLPFEQVEK